MSLVFDPSLIHYAGIGAAIGLSAVGAGVGQGLAAAGSLDSITRQPTSSPAIFRALVIGLALIESGAILALVVTLMTIFTPPAVISFGTAFAELGVGLAIGCAAAATSIASSFAVRSSTISMARQPFFAQKILTMMLVVQSIIEAPTIFAFIIGLLIKSQIRPTMSDYDGMRLLAVGLAMAIGCIGPCIGQAIFANSVCRAVGLNRNAYSQLFSFALLAEAVIETPLIFSLISSILIIYRSINPATELFSAATYVVAAVAVGFGALGTSTGTGMVAARTAQKIALNPTMQTTLLRLAIMGMAFIDSCAIYALITTLLLIMKAG